MTRHTKIVAADPLRHSHQTGGADATFASPHPVATRMFGEALTYDWRTEDCAACDEDSRCEFCTGSGEVTAACVECSRIVPLNGDGECAKCVDAGELSLAEFAAKYHPRVSVSL